MSIKWLAFPVTYQFLKQSFAAIFYQVEGQFKVAVAAIVGIGNGGGGVMAEVIGHAYHLVGLLLRACLPGNAPHP